MTIISTYIPKLDELTFREILMHDERTMSYNAKWGGTISFPKERWQAWYTSWITNAKENKRFYRYLQNEAKEFVGEIAYHFDSEYDKYIANVLILAKYRGMGYGNQGLTLLLEHAKKNGLTELCDSIAIDNPSIQLFLDRGFIEEFRTDEIVVVKKVL